MTAPLCGLCGCSTIPLPLYLQYVDGPHQCLAMKRRRNDNDHDKDRRKPPPAPPSGADGDPPAPQKGKPGRKPRVPGYPKRPMSAYNLYFKDVRKELTEAHPKSGDSRADFAAVTRKISERWKALPQEQKDEYEVQAKKELTQYKQTVQEYEKEKSAEAAAQEESERQQQHLMMSVREEGDSSMGSSILPHPYAAALTSMPSNPSNFAHLNVKPAAQPTSFPLSRINPNPTVGGRLDQLPQASTQQSQANVAMAPSASMPIQGAAASQQGHDSSRTVELLQQLLASETSRTNPSSLAAAGRQSQDSVLSEALVGLFNRQQSQGEPAGHSSAHTIRSSSADTSSLLEDLLLTELLSSTQQQARQSDDQALLASLLLRRQQQSSSTPDLLTQVLSSMSPRTTNRPTSDLLTTLLADQLSNVSSSEIINLLTSILLSQHQQQGGQQEQRRQSASAATSLSQEQLEELIRYLQDPNRRL